MRVLFVQSLLVAVWVVLWNDPNANNTATLSALARVGQAFFIAVTGTQLTLVLLAAPAATAGAICLDRARGTLTHLLVTDLSDAEIVLGKLAARLVPVLGLVACTLPFMTILTLMGGVDPDALLGAFVASVGIALLGCSLALCFSLWAGKTHEALMGTYAVWALWLLAVPMWNLISRGIGWGYTFPLWTANPYSLVFAPYWWPGTVGWADFAIFFGITSGLSLVLACLAMFRLRPVCTREKVKARRVRRWRLGTGDVFAPPIQMWKDAIRFLLDINPVLWRELHRNRPSRLTFLVGTLYFGFSGACSLCAMFWGGNATEAWVNGLQVSVGLLILSVTAATSLAEERVRGSLDVLLATPLPTRSIVFGKWVGTYRLVPVLAVLPTLVILFAGRWEWKIPGALLTAFFVLSCGAAITGLGLLLATWMPRVSRSVAMTVTIYVFVTVGILFMFNLFRNGSSEGLMMVSPFFGPGEMAFEYCSGAIRPTHFEAAVAWPIVYSGAALLFYLMTLATFDRALGRVEVFEVPLWMLARRKPRRVPRALMHDESFDGVGFVVTDPATIEATAGSPSRAVP